jgi:hypothetical protein
MPNTLISYEDASGNNLPVRRGSPLPVNDYWVQHAIDVIEGTYGDIVSVDAKKKDLFKFGKNNTLGTSQETVWLRGGHETYPTTNAIDKFSSSDGGDDQSIVVEGHTVDGSGNFTFVTQTVTLDGQTETSLTTPLARATRVYNNGATDFAGTVYVYEDDTVTNGVPQTSAKIHLQTEGTNNQSLKAATTISNVDYWLIGQIHAGVNKKTTASVDFQFQIREKGKVFRTRVPGSASSSGAAFSATLRPFLIVPKNADFRITAVGSTTNVSVEAWANGPLASVQS